MSPELMSAIRTMLIALGGYAIGKDWFPLDAAGVAELAGALVLVLAALWGVWAKRPASSEAQRNISLKRS